MIAATVAIAAAVTFDSTVKFVHVVLAIVAVGSNAAYAIWLAGAGGAASEPRVLAGLQRLHHRLTLPAYGLLGASGAILVVRGPWDVTTPWIAVASGLSLLAVVTAVLMYRVAARYTTIAWAVTATLVVIITFLMVTKPE